MSLKVLAELPIIVVLMYQVGDILLIFSYYVRHAVTFSGKEISDYLLFVLKIAKE